MNICITQEITPNYTRYNLTNCPLLLYKSLCEKTSLQFTIGLIVKFKQGIINCTGMEARQPFVCMFVKAKNSQELSTPTLNGTSVTAQYVLLEQMTSWFLTRFQKQQTFF